MEEDSLESRKFFSKAITTTDTAYNDGDQIGTKFEIPGVAMSKGSPVILESVSVIDKDKQASALVIFFFSQSPTVASSDNAALDITDAEMASKCIGHVAIAAADYKPINGSSVATKANIQLQLKPGDEKSGTVEGKSIYAILMSNGTPDYAAGEQLILNMGFKQ